MCFQDEVHQQSLHTMLYILNKAGKALDFHKIFKIMYFAERKHLARYGRMITEDDYIKMDNGPVPSAAYDILKNVKELPTSKYKNQFRVYGRYQVEALENYDEDEFSKTDLECLDESINENINLSFGQLTNKSHDDAWEYAQYSLNVNEMAEAEGASLEMIKYINNIKTLKNTQFFQNDKGR